MKLTPEFVVGMWEVEVITVGKVLNTDLNLQGLVMPVSRKDILYYSHQNMIVPCHNGTNF